MVRASAGSGMAAGGMAGRRGAGVFAGVGLAVAASLLLCFLAAWQLSSNSAASSAAGSELEQAGESALLPAPPHFLSLFLLRVSSPHVLLFLAFTPFSAARLPLAVSPQVLVSQLAAVLSDPQHWQQLFSSCGCSF